MSNPLNPEREAKQWSTTKYGIMRFCQDKLQWVTLIGCVYSKDEALHKLQEMWIKNNGKFIDPLMLVEKESIYRPKMKLEVNFNVQESSIDS